MEQRTPRGIRNNNPLNIRKGNNWQGERHPQADTAFEEYTSMTWGLRAGIIILRKYMRPRPAGYGCTCIRDIIRKWAPPSENDTVAYINRVCRVTKMTATEIFTFHEREKICEVVYAMCLVECGQPIPRDIISNAYALAAAI